MPALLREVLGDVLRRARTTQGRTLRQVSDSARVSLGYLSEVERGRKEASSELLSAICHALDVPLSQLLVDASEQLERQESDTDRHGERGQYRRQHQGRHPARRRNGCRVTRRQGCGNRHGTDKLSVHAATYTQRRS